MEFHFWGLLILGFLLSFIIVALVLYKGRDKNAPIDFAYIRFLFISSALASIVGGLLLSVLLKVMLPTYFIVNGTDEDYCEKVYVLNLKISEIGGRYIDNRTDQTFYLVGAAYGDATIDEDEEFNIIEPGISKAYSEDIEFFKEVYQMARTKGSGTTLWFLMTEEQLNNSANKSRYDISYLRDEL